VKTVLAVDGVPTPEDLAQKIPPPERLARRPVVIAECFQPIPCDPCSHACPRQAIGPFKDINEIPQVDYEKCNGCGQCITRCPGLALFVVDLTYGENEALIKLPYEFLPLPEEGQEVAGVNRAGEKVCRARVVKVVKTEKMDKTAVIWLAVPKDLAMEVRHFAIK
jgi:Fe-S-cluster-containing hydrogenase component 2